ncbi:hypothetical protein CF647_36770 [Burkholderia sp. 117]|nr:hypothetical protein CF649_37370 [Burkholderia sp. 136(2017)]PNX22151.1 hypothetical protein CF647_36770 [Burkholderia sp. 117]PNX27951.1 hypothetical protein CF648_37365 [Burkholderia sp. 137]
MRSLPREAREERRRQVINLRKRGWAYDEIADHTDLSRTGAISASGMRLMARRPCATNPVGAR